MLRELDILQELNKKKLVTVYTSITGVSESIRQQLEPRTSTYKTRLKIVETLSKAGIYCGVMNAPIIPGINDHEMHDVIKAAANAGAKSVGYLIVRLNGAIGGIFKDWLQITYPDSADKIIHHIESCHGGTVNDSRYGKRMTGEGNIAKMIKNQFEIYVKKYELNQERYEYDYTQFKRPNKGGQLELF